MRIELFCGDDMVLDGEYYSVGGGFVKSHDDTPSKPIDVPYPYHTMDTLKKVLRHADIPLEQLLRANERAITGRSNDEINRDIDAIIDTMVNSVERGLATDGLLPGPIGLMRKAQVLFKNAMELPNQAGASLGKLNAFALAASEENAAGRKVVTAPTSGSAGLMPALLYLARTELGLTQEQQRTGIIAAGMIAFIAKHNASIAGAEVGCQGEIGVASSMGAAFMAAANGYSIRQIENGAEIALEHHLGMTCDPIEGYVQIPCIERNAVGAVTAMNAYLLATVGDSVRQKVSFDDIVETMMETGRDMSSKYKETARGGMACVVSC